jgi:tetratricopeptide (TPR) repeat protein
MDANQKEFGGIMAKGGVSRKQLLNEPDKFMTFTGKLIAYAKSHLKPILICSAVVFLSLIIVATVGQVSRRNEKKASARVEKAVAKYVSILQDKDANAAYEEVKSEFNDIFDAYGSKNAVKIARIVYGDMSYSAGDADTAISMYQRALDDFNPTQGLKNIILSGLGHAYLLKKDYSQSIQYFEKISAGHEKTLKSDAMLNLAWLYETTGDKARSLAEYKQILADFPDTMYGDMIREKISG